MTVPSQGEPGQDDGRIRLPLAYHDAAVAGALRGALGVESAVLLVVAWCCSPRRPPPRACGRGRSPR